MYFRKSFKILITFTFKLFDKVHVKFHKYSLIILITSHKKEFYKKIKVKRAGLNTKDKV